MSDERNLIEELRQCFIDLFDYPSNWPDHGNVPLALSSKAALLKNEVKELERQLTAERERVRMLENVIHSHHLAHHSDGHSPQAVCTRSPCHGLLQVQPHAPAKPCPDCGATDRAHTCPNWRESSEYKERRKEAINSLTLALVHTANATNYASKIALKNDGESAIDAILAAIDARLARGK